MNLVSHTEHPSKAGAWRAGKPVVLPDAAAADCTVWFGLPPDGTDAIQWEGLLANRLAPDRARLCAIPLFLHGVGLGDEVALMESAEGASVVTAIARRSPNGTLRVGFEDASPTDIRWQGLMRDLEPHRCWFDVFTPKLIAVSVPPDAYGAVWSDLSEREARGELEFDVGREADRLGD